MIPTPRFRFSGRGLSLVVAACFALIATFTLLRSGAADIIHTEPSQFAPVVVFEEGGFRCMNFESVNDDGRQSCLNLKSPDRLVFGYTKIMMSALFINPQPRNILLIGLGGGTLARALGKVVPEAVIDTVEIDPAVARVAEQFFGYRPGPKQHLFIEDGRAFIERAHAEGRQYDVIMLDAFDVDYIPAHLLTREFLQHVHGALSPNGVLVSNTFSNSDMYDRESATYADVFGPFFNLRDGNRVIIATRGPLPNTAVLRRNADALAATLKPLGVDVDDQLSWFSREPDWNQQAPVLTDPVHSLHQPAISLPAFARAALLALRMRLSSTQ
jgi:spermidine synthase